MTNNQNNQQNIQKNQKNQNNQNNQNNQSLQGNQPSKFIADDIQQVQNKQSKVEHKEGNTIDLQTLSLYGKLALIQNELKVPKNQVNSFGHYNFRSCEDILEASKKVCKKYYTTLVVYDEIEVFANRFYVKAIAELHDWFSDNVIKTHAYAREADSKTGMDLAQVTGASSSYARKYALNGLFNIDDEKDPDTNEYRNQNKNNQNYQKNQKNYNQNGYNQSNQYNRNNYQNIQNNQNMQVQNQPRNAQNNQSKTNTQSSQNNQNNQKFDIDPTKVINETKALLQACTNLQINLNSESMIKTINKYNNGKHDPYQMNTNELVTYNATLKKIIELKNKKSNTVEKVEDVKNIQNNQNNQNNQNAQQSQQNKQVNQVQAKQQTQNVNNGQNGQSQPQQTQQVQQSQQNAHKFEDVTPKRDVRP